MIVRRVRFACPFLLMVLLTACAEDTIKDAEIELSIYLQPALQKSESITLASGSRVFIDKAYLSVSSVEINLCDDSAEMSASGRVDAQAFGYWLSRPLVAFPGRYIHVSDTLIPRKPIKSFSSEMSWGRLGVVYEGLMIKPLYSDIKFSLFARANAHTESSATKSGTPYWVNLQQGNGLGSNNESATFIAVLNPPSDRYCSIAIGLNSADSDAVIQDGSGIETSSESLQGYSMIIEGRYAQAGDFAEEAFLLRSSKNLLLADVLLNQLTLSGERPVDTITLQFNLKQWLNDTEESWAIGNIDNALVEMPKYWNVTEVAAQ